MAKIKKRSVGRPGRMDKLLHDMQTSVVKASEDLTIAYPKAVKYLIDTLENKEASVTNKLSAAKMIKECVEATLEELERPDEDENLDDESNSGPLLKIE